MKIFKYLSLALVALTAASCEKHEVEYKTVPVADNCAMVQIHYMTPATATTKNRIYKMELDGAVYANNYASLMAIYGNTPSYTKYYSVKAGSCPIKLFYGFYEDRIADTDGDGKDEDGVNGDANGEEFYYDDYDKMVEVYNNTITGLEAGKKYQVFVHDFAKEPVVIESTFTLTGDVATEENMTENTGECHYINFINMLYEDDGQPYQGKVQYYRQYTTDWENKVKSEWLPVGEPIAFGESTGWLKLHVIKETYNSSGSARVDYRILDENGNDLQIINSKGNGYADFSDYWTAYIGRHELHIIRGFRDNTASRAGITQLIKY